jgi:hypothetical protein
MPLDLMIDFETLGSGTRPYLMTMAAVLFDPNSIDDPQFSPHPIRRCFVCAFDWTAQTDRRVELPTLMWWLSKNGGGGGEALMAQLKPDFNDYMWHVKTFENFYSLLFDFVKEEFHLDKSKIWARGTNFDVRILEEIYCDIENKAYACGQVPTLPRFWRYDMIEDVRTAMRATGITKSSNPNLHNPMADCLYQIYDVQRSIAHMKLAKGLATISTSVCQP